VKTTIDLSDALAIRAKAHARRVGRPLRELVEEGLRRVLEAAEEEETPFVLPDRSVGRADGPNPLESLTWQDLREEIYGK